MLGPKDRRIAQALRRLPIPLVASKRNPVTTWEGERRISRTRLVWRRLPVTRATLDEILATLSDQGDRVKVRMATARAARGHPHVSKTRTLIPLFAKLAAGKVRRQRLRDQRRRYEARFDAEAEQFRAETRTKAEVLDTAATRACAPTSENEVMSLEERRAFTARHRGITEADERMEDISYSQSWQRAFRHRHRPGPEEDDPGIAAALRLGYTIEELNKPL